MVEVTRRDIITLGGGAVVGAILGGVGVTAITRGQSRPSASTAPVTALSVESWISSRSVPYYIAQGGIADVIPTQTLIGYQSALQQGAQVIELSVVMSKDRVLYCLAGLSLSGLTTMTGPARSRTSTEIDAAKVRIPRLGSAWLGPNMPSVPRLDQAIDTLAGHVLLCVEALDDDAYPLMIKALEAAALHDAIIVKAGPESPRLKEAQKAGYPVAARFASVQSVSAGAIRSTVKQLDPRRDSLVLPTRDATGELPVERLRRASDSGVPTWITPVHRRSEMRQFTQLGVSGMLTPSIGYLTSNVGQLSNDTWANGAISAGEITKDPASDTYALDWTVSSVLGLAARRRPAFVMLGQFCPIAAPSYRITFDLAFDPLPDDKWQNASIAFGHSDDRYYEHRGGSADGYHAMIRANGSMAICAHFEGDPNAEVLAERNSTAPLKAGSWSRMTLDVSPDTITWSRDDGTTLTTKDDRFRGGYLHIGRSSVDGRLNVRGLSIA